MHSTSEVFQKEVTLIISDIPGSGISQDDFVVWEKKIYRNRNNEVWNEVNKMER